MLCAIVLLESMEFKGCAENNKLDFKSRGEEMVAAAPQQLVWLPLKLQNNNIQRMPIQSASPFGLD